MRGGLHSLGGGMAKSAAADLPAVAGAAMSADPAVATTTAGQVSLKTGCTP